MAFADLAYLYSRFLDGWCLSCACSSAWSLSPLKLTVFVVQAVAKTSAAPIERIKLLVQNQDEMVCLSFGPRYSSSQINEPIL